jgi:DNA-binding NarL/FixJ family response regulator
VTSTVPGALRVLIQHSSPLLHAGLHAVLDSEAGVHIVGCGPTGAAPDLVVADYACAVEVWLPRRAAMRQQRTERPPRLMVVTSIDRERQIHQALAQGVDGYVAETAPLAEFRQGLRQIAQGKRFVSSCFSHMLVNGLTQPELTLREQAVLALISLGRPNKTIARDLEIASGTVKSHVRSILAKLDVTTRTEAAHVAQLRGLVQFRPGEPVDHFAQYRAVPAPWGAH